MTTLLTTIEEWTGFFARVKMRRDGVSTTRLLILAAFLITDDPIDATLYFGEKSGFFNHTSTTESVFS